MFWPVLALVYIKYAPLILFKNSDAWIGLTSRLDYISARDPIKKYTTS